MTAAVVEGLDVEHASDAEIVAAVRAGAALGDRVDLALRFGRHILDRAESDRARAARVAELETEVGRLGTLTASLEEALAVQSEELERLRHAADAESRSAALAWDLHRSVEEHSRTLGRDLGLATEDRERIEDAAHARLTTDTAGLTDEAIRGLHDDLARAHQVRDVALAESESLRATVRGLATQTQSYVDRALAEGRRIVELTAEVGRIRADPDAVVRCPDCGARCENCTEIDERESILS